MLLLAALGGFALMSKLVNRTAGIVPMVFIASVAGTTYSWARNLKIATGLIAVASTFQKPLGLNLPLL